MDLFLIILSGVCLIGLAIYWIRLWREARDRKRAQALHRVANEKAAVRGLVHQRAPEFTRAEAQKIMDKFRDAYPRIVAVYRRASDDSQLSPEEAKAMKAMDWGADDSRWEPGTTAVDALIKERDNLLAQVQALTVENKALSMGYKNDPTTSGMITHDLASQSPWMVADERGNQRFSPHEPERIPGRPVFRYNPILRSWDVA